LTFVMPKRAGVYEFRLYADNAFTVVLATSAPVTIASASMPAGAPPTASPPATAPTPTPAPPASPQASPPPSVPTPAPLPPQASPSPPLQASGLPKGDCSSEGSLAARTDIVFCEPWERRDWWLNGYVRDGSKTDPRPATEDQLWATSIVSTGCISGSCLKVDMPKDVTGSLAIHWPLTAAGLAPEQLYLRYYIKLGPSWDPYQSDQSSGGKFPGLADVRTGADPAGQCGNGGEPGDGINCWSMRSVFHDCWYTFNG